MKKYQHPCMICGKPVGRKVKYGKMSTNHYDVYLGIGKYKKFIHKKCYHNLLLACLDSLLRETDTFKEILKIDGK